MGVEPFLISSTLIGVVAQRLLRTVCSGCKEEVPPHDRLVQILTRNGIAASDIRPTQGKGCTVCSSTGYKGRVGIYELLVVSDEMRHLVLNSASAKEMLDAARKEGLRTLYEDGLIKVASGQTTYEELMRVTAE